MLAALVVIALLNGIFAPPAKQEEPPPEVKVIEVTDMTASDIENAAVKKGWYKADSNGVSYWGGEDDPSIDAVQAPPTDTKGATVKASANVTKPMDDETAETVGGLLILIALAVIAWRLSRGKGGAQTKRGNGVSEVQYQALFREIAGMNKILQNVVPDGGGAKAMERKKKW